MAPTGPEVAPTGVDSREAMCTCGHRKGSHPRGLSENIVLTGKCFACTCQSFTRSEATHPGERMAQALEPTPGTVNEQWLLVRLAKAEAALEEARRENEVLLEHQRIAAGFLEEYGQTKAALTRVREALADAIDGYEEMYGRLWAGEKS